MSNETMTDAQALADSLDQIAGSAYGGYTRKLLPEDVRDVLRRSAARLRGEATRYLPARVTDCMATAAAREWCGLTDTSFDHLTPYQQHRATEDFRIVLRSALRADGEGR